MTEAEQTQAGRENDIPKPAAEQAPQATGGEARRTAKQQPIENYGVIGDLNTIALVSMEGSIDFLCFPEFDSPSTFAALLDGDKGGRFSISPCLSEYRVKQMYLPDTNILLTRFLSAGAMCEITDFMPISEEGVRHQIVRLTRVIKGEVTFEMECTPAFDYGRAKHTLTEANGHLEFQAQGEVNTLIRLAGNAPLTVDGTTARSRFTLKKGETTAIVLDCPCAGDAPPSVEDKVIQTHLQSTASYWRAWVGKSIYKGRWREMVTRSALVLKLMCSRKYGSIIAAPTFGLPETIGGERNWDYRYTWLRDAAFTLYAFMRLGYTEEAGAFMKWLKDRVVAADGERGPLEVMYGIAGETKLDEYTLDGWSGYRDSRPVRVGNAAYTQLQLDIYGELMDAVYLSSKYGDAISHEGWEQVHRLIDWLAEHWREPDDGIWEVRGGPREFLHSRVMCWVAVDRAIRLGEKRSLPVKDSRWTQLRTDIYNSIFADFYNQDVGAFVAYKGADYVDASALLMPLVRFMSPTDPLWTSTLEKIERDLTEDALVYRYRTQEAHGVDGLHGSEGSFTACSFWYVECLARSHQTEKARALFERMLGYANHLGLYSEELGPSGDHLGNFPQALTHLALISAASYLDRELSGQRGEWR